MTLSGKMQSPLFLIHIGTGKTGTTSVQRFFLKHRDQCRQNRLDYFGLHLDLCDLQLDFPWLHTGQAFLFQQLNDSDARDQLSLALDTYFQRNQCIDCAFWSFEAIYQRPQVYIPVLMRLKDRFGINIKPFAFVRNHVSFLVSAYKQWGIKHKTGSGPVLPFQEWVEQNNALLSYGQKLKNWDDAFGESFLLFNYDACVDVVSDVLGLLPGDLGKNLAKVHQGEAFHSTPPDHVLSLYALFNNRSESPVLPEAMGELLRRYPKLRNNHPPLVSAADLFPDTESAAFIAGQKLLRFDSALINAMLRSRSQPMLELASSVIEPSQFQSDYALQSTLLSMLLTIVEEQDHRIKLLEERLEAEFSP